MVRDSAGGSTLWDNTGTAAFMRKPLGLRGNEREGACECVCVCVCVFSRACWLGECVRKRGSTCTWVPRTQANDMTPEVSKDVSGALKKVYNCAYLGQSIFQKITKNKAIGHFRFHQILTNGK